MYKVVLANDFLYLSCCLDAIERVCGMQIRAVNVAVFTVCIIFFVVISCSYAVYVAVFTVFII